MKLSEFYRSEETFGGESDAVDNRQRHVLNMINQMQGSIALLDFGCGTGFFKKGLRSGIEYFGCDIGGATLENESIRKITDDSIPFADDSFDVVYAGEVIEHLVDTDSFMREARRVLKKDGLLIVTTPNLACWINRVMLVLGYQPYFTELSFEDKTLGRMPILRRFEKQKMGMGHLRVFTRKGLKDFIELHGFTNLSQMTVPLDLNPIYFILDKIFNIIGWGSDIVSISRNKK
jgi:SAM-dependent methyltransferase